MGLPGIDQDNTVVGQRCLLTSNAERAVTAAGLDQDVAMMVRMSHQGCVHIEQGHPAKATLKQLDRRGHSSCSPLLQPPKYPFVSKLSEALAPLAGGIRA